MKKISFYKSAIGVLFFIQPIFGFSNAENNVLDSNFNPTLMGQIFFLIGMSVVFLVIGFLFKFFFTMMEIQKLRFMKEQGIEIVEKTKALNEKTFVERIYDWAIGLKPLEKEADILLDHDYDGIKELDNSLPPWWLGMFYLSIFFAVGYIFYFHYFEYGPLQAEEYAIEMKWANQQKQRLLAIQADRVNENTVVAFEDEALLAAGESIYQLNCAACHGKLGEGGVGPNLTDEYWLHGGDIKSIFKTVKYGVPQKGMISWKTQMSPSSMQEVSSFILTLVGTNPPNPKAPQGEIFEGPEKLINTDSLPAAIGMN